MNEMKMADTSWSTSKWLSKTAAAKYIHRSDAALQRLLDSGAIPASQAPFERGGAKVVYISIDDLDAYMRSTPYVPRGSGAGRAMPREAEVLLQPRAPEEIPPYRAIARGRKVKAS